MFVFRWLVWFVVWCVVFVDACSIVFVLAEWCYVLFVVCWCSLVTARLSVVSTCSVLDSGFLLLFVSVCCCCLLCVVRYVLFVGVRCLPFVVVCWLLVVVGCCRWSLFIVVCL